MYHKELYSSFKRWTGCAVSLLLSMNKTIKIGILLTVYASSWFSGKVVAQKDTSRVSKKINIEEVQVSARRSTTVYSEIGRTIHVIPRKEIEAMPVNCVQDLLNYLVNVDVRQRGANGMQADISMRGGSFDQVMVLLNGVNVTDPQTGHLSLNLPVDLQSIERIEVLEGPGARVYGPNAFSGAINFITGTKTVDNISGNISSGEHGVINGAVNNTFNVGNYRNYVAAGYGRSDGYMYNTDYNFINLFYQGQLTFDDEQLAIQVGYTDKSFGANGFYSPAYPDQYEQNRTTFATIKMSSGKKVRITPSLYWRRHQDRFELFRYEPAAWYQGHNHHLTDVYGANLNMVIPWIAGKTSIGGEFRSETVWSTVLGNKMEESKPVPGEEAEFTNYYGRSNASVFVEHAFSWNQFSLSAGVLFNANSGLDWKYDIFPGFDISYQIFDGVRAYGSINKSLRMPTFTDLFYSHPTDEGNIHLKPEESISYEGGFKYNQPILAGRLSSFYRNGKSLIDWGKMYDPETGTYDDKNKARNVGNVNAWGIEASVKLDMKAWIRPDFFIHSIEASYAWLDQDHKSMLNYESKYVLDFLKHKANLRIHHDIVSKLEMTWNVLYQDRNGTYEAYLGKDDAGKAIYQTMDYEPFTTVDARLSWIEKKYRIYVEATNLFDESYQDLGNLIQPGRWIKGGIQFSFDL